MEHDELIKKADEMVTKHCGDQVKFIDQVALAEDIVALIEEHAPECDSEAEPQEDAIPEAVIQIAAACRDAGMKIGHRHGDIVDEICAFIRRGK